MRLSFARVAEAAQAIDPVFLRTPQYECEPLSAAIGVSLLLKVETANPIRSFKGRGAAFLVSQLDPDETIVCASAGNFGQAMAYACRSRRMKLTVFAAVNANPLKLERMRCLGADVRQEGEDFDAAKLAARRYAAENGLRFVEDGLEPATAEGAGTIGVELAAAGLDVLLVPLGNGALAAGVALALRQLAPAIEIVLVQAAGASAMAESLRTGRTVARQYRHHRGRHRRQNSDT